MMEHAIGHRNTVIDHLISRGDAKASPFFMSKLNNIENFIKLQYVVARAGKRLYNMQYGGNGECAYSD